MTRPFGFEGRQRATKAEHGIANLTEGKRNEPLAYFHTKSPVGGVLVLAASGFALLGFPPFSLFASELGIARAG